MGDTARLGDRAVRPSDHRASQVDREVGSGHGGDLHGRRPGQQLASMGHPVAQRSIVANAVEHLRVLVGQHQNPGAVGKDGRAFLSVQQALHSAVGNEVGSRQSCQHRRVVGKSHRRSGGADRDGAPVGGRGQHHGRHRGTEALQGDHGRLDQFRTAVVLGQHHGRLAGVHCTTGEVVGERLDPMPRHTHVSPPIPS